MRWSLSSSAVAASWPTVPLDTGPTAGLSIGAGKLDIRPVQATRQQLGTARDHLADIRALDARIKYIGVQIAALVAASGTGLTGLFGVGPVIAGRILAEVGVVARFATEDTFASYNGTAPIDVSSGDQIRHRLSRAGNRRINHALHMMAVTQIRYPGTPGRPYYERKRTEGKTPKAALRSPPEPGGGERPWSSPKCWQHAFLLRMRSRISISV